MTTLRAPPARRARASSRVAPTPPIAPRARRSRSARQWAPTAEWARSTSAPRWEPMVARAARSRCAPKRAQQRQCRTGTGPARSPTSQRSGSLRDDAGRLVPSDRSADGAYGEGAPETPPCSGVSRRSARNRPYTRPPSPRETFGAWRLHGHTCTDAGVVIRPVGGPSWQGSGRGAAGPAGWQSGKRPGTGPICGDALRSPGSAGWAISRPSGPIGCRRKFRDGAELSSREIATRSCCCRRACVSGCPRAIWRGL
jgi:hypothetical protein